MDLEDNIYVGGEPDDDLGEESSAADRGDLIEGQAPPEEPVEAPDEEAVEAPPEEPTEEPTEAEEPTEEPTEAEEPTEEPVVEEKPPQREQQRIPKQRFDEVNLRRQAAEAKARQLEEELKRLKGSGEGVEQFDFDAKEEEYMSAVVDGEFAKAKAVRSEIRRAEQESYKRVVAQAKGEAVSQTQSELSYQQTVKELEAQYPSLNYQDQEHYDEVATQEALELHGAYMQMGKYPSAADSLRAAVGLIAVKYQLDKPEVEEVAPEIEPEPKPRPKAAAQERKKAAAAATQPKIPSAGSPGTPATSDIVTMSEDEFDALPEAKKAELRGDLV